MPYINIAATTMKATEKITRPIIPLTTAPLDFCFVRRRGSFTFPSPINTMRIEPNMKSIMNNSIMRNPNIPLVFGLIFSF